MLRAHDWLVNAFDAADLSVMTERGRAPASRRIVAFLPRIAKSIAPAGVRLPARWADEHQRRHGRDERLPWRLSNATGTTVASGQTVGQAKHAQTGGTFVATVTIENTAPDLFVLYGAACG
jgi:hypothetical protein